MLDRIEVGRVWREVDTLDAVIEQPCTNQIRLMLRIVILKEPPLLRVVDIEVKLSRLDEMRSQDALQQRAVHVLIEDIAVAESLTAEAAPNVDLLWMRIIIDAILRIQCLTSRPTNEYLTPKSLAPEDLLVGEYDIHPLGWCPILVAFSE